MAETKIPRGGRKGGTRFPNVPLKQAVEYAKKLVAKTHTGPQPDTVVLKGVFNSATSEGKIRASALKQYDLLTGETDAYDATGAARAINSTPDGEVAPLIRTALLKPPVFKMIFETFQNDTVSRAKIRQQALQLKVHPDVVDKCVDIFVQSALFAGVATESGDGIAISNLAKSSEATAVEEGRTDDSTPVDTPVRTDDGSGVGSNAEGTGAASNRESLSSHSVPRAQINVTLALDSTMDPEKLERYMKILRQYGAIG
ncbi:MAG: hypothetical protein QM715_03530 [Nibricoccus sp.]